MSFESSSAKTTLGNLTSNANQFMCYFQLSWMCSIIGGQIASQLRNYGTGKILTNLIAYTAQTKFVDFCNKRGNAETAEINFRIVRKKLFQ